MPRLRRDVSRYARSHGIRDASRHFGIPPGTICKWCSKANKVGDVPILTQSSRPKTHPNEVPKAIVNRIISLRKEHGRTSEVVHQQLFNEGITVSLNSVRRYIDRAGLMKKKSPWKRYHPSVPRPIPFTAGDLVQMDTVHRMINMKKRLYVFTLIDVHSRWVYAKAYEHMNGRTSIEFLREAQSASTFKFKMLQSDHGPEFSRWFLTQIKKNHRYTRIGKPNDNAHIERFNRTVQEKCLDKVPTEVNAINCALKKYLQYYNHERLHMGIRFKTPIQLTV